MGQPLPTRGPSSADIIEDDSKHILRDKLPRNEVLITPTGDKYPNIDGIMEFLNDDGTSTARKLFYQLKGTRGDATYYDCDVHFLRYCYLSEEPTFLILVDVAQKKVYWEHIDKSYIAQVLEISDLSTFNQLTKRVQFSSSKTIDGSGYELKEECRRHYEKLPNPSPAPSFPAETDEPSELKHFDKTKKELSDAFNGIEERTALYFALVYSLRPFYLDRRGDGKRTKLLSFLKISEAEERFIIEKLTNAGLFERTGDLLTAEKDHALSAMNHFIDKGVLDPAEVVKLLS